MGVFVTLRDLNTDSALLLNDTYGNGVVVCLTAYIHGCSRFVVCMRPNRVGSDKNFAN